MKNIGADGLMRMAVKGYNHGLDTIYNTNLDLLEGEWWEDRWLQGQTLRSFRWSVLQCINERFKHGKY